jgi:hypothetical protein
MMLWLETPTRRRRGSIRLRTGATNSGVRYVCGSTYSRTFPARVLPFRLAWMNRLTSCMSAPPNAGRPIRTRSDGPVCAGDLLQLAGCSGSGAPVQVARLAGSSTAIADRGSWSGSWPSLTGHSEPSPGLRQSAKSGLRSSEIARSADRAGGPNWRTASEDPASSTAARSCVSIWLCWPEAE